MIVILMSHSYNSYTLGSYSSQKNFFASMLSLLIFSNLFLSSFVKCAFVSHHSEPCVLTLQKN